MKALVLLKNTKCLLSNGCGIGFTVESLNEAINELEELQNRSCESCKHGKYGIDSIGREVECKLLWRCSRGYDDKYERKEND